MKSYLILVFIVVTANMFLLSDCYSWNDSVQLMSDLFTVYDNRPRPILNQSRPITVNVTFKLIAIQEFEEIKQMFSALGILVFEWQDQILVWNPDFYGGITSLLLKRSEIWYPSFYLGNPFDGIVTLGEDWISTRVMSNGKANTSVVSKLVTSCAVDVTYYPFDSQDCLILFIPSGYSLSEMTVNPINSHMVLELYTENGGWKHANTSIEVESNSNFLSINIKITRKPMFVVVNIILPILFLSVINALVFIIPPESGERISFSVTILLALSVFLTLVGDNLPKTSEPISILSYYLMFSLIMSTLICVVVILNLRLYFKKSNIPIPGWCVSVTHVVKCKCRPKTTGDIDCNDIMSTSKENDDLVNIDMRKASLPGDVKEDANHKPIIDIKWPEVSSAVDTVCILFFIVLITVATTSYIGILWLKT